MLVKDKNMFGKCFIEYFNKYNNTWLQRIIPILITTATKTNLILLQKRQSKLFYCCFNPLLLLPICVIRQRVLTPPFAKHFAGFLLAV
ncbi:hypothetical protein LH29_08185 [Draconibacterium sediminis]|uniref:Uncharacterized protein n=1 Tax=Draconibacterium sediminis TaxID=1544798 RepID=A0A0D8JHM5_9BACT|nr:hypothetical protein LH29_08185 [Draconibacterium sediminis]